MRLYLNKAIQSITAEHAQISTLNTLLNNSKLQDFEEKITDLTGITEKILDQSSDKTIKKEIHSYIEKNQNWLREYLPDIEQLRSCLGRLKD